MNVFIHDIASWFELISLAYCTGVLVCRLLVLPPSAPAGFSGQGYFPVRAWRLFGIALAVMFAGSAADLLLRAAGMTGRPVSDVFPEMSTVLFHTHYGRVWMIRIAALLLLSFFSAVELRHRSSRIFLAAALSLVVVVAATRSASGHASDAGDFSMAEIMDWLHLMAASVWGGGLFVLSVVILPEVIRSDELPASLLASVAGRFSRMAGAAVGVLAFTALYNAWLHVGSLEGLWLTPYGDTVIIKILLFFLLVNLGAFNRYVSVPLLQEFGGIDPGRRGFVGRLAVRVMPRSGRNQDARGAASRFMRSVKTEAMLVAIVLLLAALLAQEVPARHALRAMSGQGHAHNMRINR
ncbi:MAG: CopD family protein [Candidatus Sulfobium sp.]|jgi:putative copper resistance protein D